MTTVVYEVELVIYSRALCSFFESDTEEVITSFPSYMVAMCWQKYKIWSTLVTLTVLYQENAMKYLHQLINHYRNRWSRNYPKDIRELCKLCKVQFSSVDRLSANLIKWSNKLKEFVGNSWTKLMWLKKSNQIFPSGWDVSQVE